MWTARTTTEALTHLVRRFFGFLTAQPLTPREQSAVHDALDPALHRLFFAQSIPDQRHAVQVAERAEGGSDRVEAALLHDVGKTGSSLGAFGRSFATVAGALNLPARRRWLTYLHHGAIGADMLQRAGASNLSVAFARSHPGPVPDGIDPDDWHALAEADEV